MRIGFGEMNNQPPTVWIIKDDNAYSAEKIAKAVHYNKLGIFNDMSSFLAEGGLESVRGWVSKNSLSQIDAVKFDKIHWLAPISWRSKIMLSVVNYSAHGEEVKRKPPSLPFLFSKPGSALTGPYDKLLKPAWATRMDYESELVVVIGTPTKDVPEEKALSHVAGYMVANDIGFRDLQWNTGHEDLTTSYGMNWLQGKGLDTTFPAGPWLVTVDESGHGPFDIETILNGETVQHASTQEMIYGAAQFISNASRGLTLWPGDVISTGSPGGSPLKSGRRYMEPGDVLETKITGLGTLKNEIVAAPTTK